jgi:hypothetical protein
MKNISIKSIATFFSLIILSVSCNKYDDLSDNDNSLLKSKNQETLSSYVGSHLALTDKLISLLNTEKELDLAEMENLSDHYETVDELKSELASIDILNFEEIAITFFEIQENTNEYLNSIGEFEQENLIILIENEIFKQSNSTVAKHGCHPENGSCWCQWERDRTYCGAAYAVSLAASAISGLISFGIGTGIGLVAGAALYGACTIRAQNSFHDCAQ